MNGAPAFASQNGRRSSRARAGRDIRTFLAVTCTTAATLREEIPRGYSQWPSDGWLGFGAPLDNLVRARPVRDPLKTRPGKYAAYGSYDACLRNPTNPEAHLQE